MAFVPVCHACILLQDGTSSMLEFPEYLEISSGGSVLCQDHFYTCWFSGELFIYNWENLTFPLIKFPFLLITATTAIIVQTVI